MSRRALAVVFACAAVAGCGGGGQDGSGQSTLRRKIVQAQRTHEFPALKPPEEFPVGGSPSAIRAIRSFVSAYINWDAQTVSGDLRALAARSVGQARSALALAAAQTASDYELRQGGIANHGTVQAVTPLRGHSDHYVVVTLESTSSSNTTLYQGLRPAWHVALATVRQIRPGVWALSGWQPQS